MSPTLFTKPRILTISLLIVAVIVVPLIYFIYTSIERSGKTQITLLSVPKDAVITIDDKIVQPGTLYLSPGIYTIKAKKDGFEAYENREVVENNGKTVAISLNPVSDEAKKWVDQNQGLYYELEGKAGLAANQRGEEFRNKNPIVNELPFANYLYTIGYQNDPTDKSGNSIIVTIDAPAGYRNAAVNKIRELGYDPTTLKILFRDYESPFKNE